MATNFPSNLDNFTNPTSSDTLDSPDHAGQHTDVNDAVEALQEKVGVDGSAVTSSLDYKIGNVMHVVNHNNNANVTRPSPVGAVYWVGTVAPNNAIVADQWFDTTP
jgi:hypothetical protein